MDLTQLKGHSPEDKLLYSRLDDMINQTKTNFGSRFMGFLNEREIVLTKNYLRYLGVDNHQFYGGHDNSLRQVLSVFSDYAKPELTEFSVTGINFSYRKEKQLTHRDFLGTLLALQINRESLGDILVGEGSTVVFTYKHISTIILEEVKKVGNEGVDIDLNLPKTLPANFLYKETKYIISSSRLDCYVASITNQSRSVASGLIKKDMVTLNHINCDNASKLVEVGDIIAIRGYGKYSLKEFLNKTKKGRQKIVINKYI